MNYKFIMEISWKRNTTEGDSPVHEINLLSSSILSRTEHVKFCLQTEFHVFRPTQDTTR